MYIMFTLLTKAPKKQTLSSVIYSFFVRFAGGSFVAVDGAFLAVVVVVVVVVVAAEVVAAEVVLPSAVGAMSSVIVALNTYPEPSFMFMLGRVLPGNT